MRHAALVLLPRLVTLIFLSARSGFILEGERCRFNSEFEVNLRERSLSNSLRYVGNLIWSPTNQLQLPMEFHVGFSYSKPRAISGEVLLPNPP